MGKTVKIGCCGFPVSRKKYFAEYRVIELQNTFYNLPSTGWAEKIRSEAPEDFEFMVKAWQVITHPNNSPTWRKLREKPPGNPENYGWLKPTMENLEAFRKTYEIASILGSKVVILQTPASMPFNEESIAWVNEFFDKIEGIREEQILIGWEPRGEWADNYEVLRKILVNHNIIHVVDPFKRNPVSLPRGTAYYRLHGIGRGEVNYKYKYTDEDLSKLAQYLVREDFREAYVMFNNVYMYQDSKRLKELLGTQKDLTVY